MYNTLLSIHSILRWLVLITLLYSIYRSYKGWIQKSVFSTHDNSIRHITATIAQVQMTIGICLYFISPIIEYFLHNYKDAVHQREVRFFGMEHSVMMFLAVICITIGSMLAKRRANDTAKYKTMAIWFTVAFLVILLMIPWPFSSFTANRPYLRSF